MAKSAGSRAASLCRSWDPRWRRRRHRTALVVSGERSSYETAANKVPFLSKLVSVWRRRMQVQPPSHLGWLSLGEGGAGGALNVCDGRGQTALQILKQRLLEGQRESAGRYLCSAWHWTSWPPKSPGALSQACSLGGPGPSSAKRRLRGPGQVPTLVGCGVPPLRGAGRVPRLPQCRRPSASTPWLSPAFLGALKIHRFLKEPCVHSGGRTCLWESLR